MKLYVGNYWVPFPSSEYGGSWSVVAKDTEEAIKLLTENENIFYEHFVHLIPEAVAEARCFVLDPEVEYKSEIIDTFFT